MWSSTVARASSSSSTTGSHPEVRPSSGLGHGTRLAGGEQLRQTGTSTWYHLPTPTHSYVTCPRPHTHTSPSHAHALTRSTYSNPLEFSAGAGPPSTPHPPTLTQAGVHHLALEWAAPTDSGSPITAFCLEMEDPDSVGCAESLFRTTVWNGVIRPSLPGLWVPPGVPRGGAVLHLFQPAEGHWVQLPPLCY